MISRREIFKMLGLAGLGGLFSRELEAVLPRPLAEVPAELGYAVKEIRLADGSVLVQVAGYGANLDRYLDNFDPERDLPQTREVELDYDELIRYYGSAEYKEKQKLWREAMERIEKEYPSPRRV